jgi:hypothetical protein
MAQRFADLCRGNNAATMLSAPMICWLKRRAARPSSISKARIKAMSARRAAAGRKQSEFSRRVYQGYRAAIRWLYASSNRADACDILARHVPDMYGRFGGGEL